MKNARPAAVVAVMAAVVGVAAVAIVAVVGAAVAAVVVVIATGAKFSDSFQNHRPSGRWFFTVQICRDLRCRADQAPV